ncbi:hypothetical protein N9B65_06610 [Akkermansiaceae bacterium]|nr:hypothetical protein [Akkermansiaceae bacterium]
MSITWEFHFPDIIFRADRVCEKDERGRCIGNLDGWHPENDFRAYLESLAVDKKWFEGDTKWQAQSFEEIRAEMLARIEIRGDERDSYGKECFDDDYDEYVDIDFPVYKISLKDTEFFNNKVLLSNGEEHSVYGGVNQVNVFKANPMNLLFDWLFTVLPYGRSANDYYIGAFGISEYDETYTTNYQYIQDKQAKLYLQSVSISKIEPNDDNDVFSFKQEITPTHESAEDYRSIIGEMHPSDQITEWEGAGGAGAGDNSIPEFGGGDGGDGGDGGSKGAWS